MGAPHTMSSHPIARKIRAKKGGPSDEDRREAAQRRDDALPTPHLRRDTRQRHVVCSVRVRCGIVRDFLGRRMPYCIRGIHVPIDGERVGAVYALSVPAQDGGGGKGGRSGARPIA